MVNVVGGRGGGLEEDQIIIGSETHARPLLVCLESFSGRAGKLHFHAPIGAPVLTRITDRLLFFGCCHDSRWLMIKTGYGTLRETSVVSFVCRSSTNSCTTRWRSLWCAAHPTSSSSSSPTCSSRSRSRTRPPRRSSTSMRRNTL